MSHVRLSLGLAAVLLAAPALAHDEWANGVVVPAWVKAQCCGKEDVHHLRADQVHRDKNDDWLVDGYHQTVSNTKALPSQDGDYWIFYKDDWNGTGQQSTVYCFFVPMTF
jgi:hypothetical protein